MRLRVFPLLSILVVSSVLAPTPAIAQPSEADAATEMARIRFEEGVKLFDKGDYRRAQAAFLQAWALKRHPAVLLNLAQSELRAGEHVAAARHFTQYLRDYPDTPAKERATAQKGLDEARQHTGLLEIVVDGPGAEVFVDGESVGRSPLEGPIDVKPGTHEVEVRSPGMPRLAKQGTVTAGSRNTLTFQVGTPAPAPTPPPVGETSETSETSETPAEEVPAEVDEPVEHELKEETPSGRKSFVSWVASDPVAWGTLGVTGIGLGAGVTFAFMAAASARDADSVAAQIKVVAARDGELSNYEGLDRRESTCADPVPVTAKTDYRPACAQLQDTLDTRDSRKTKMWVGFGVAAVGAVGTGVAYYLRSESDGDEAAARVEPRGFTAVTPVWTPEFSGIGVTGSF